jgi:hypothetical protein
LADAAPAKGLFQLALEQLLDEAPDGSPKRLLQRIEPNLSREWQRQIVRRILGHGVGSFGRPPNRRVDC